MGFGFVVARFGLFLKELSAVQLDIQPMQGGISVRFGTGLVVIGVVFSVSAVVRYLRLLKRLNRGETLAQPSPLAVSLGAVLALIGLLVSIYLLVTP